MDDLARAFINYIRDRVIKYKLTADCLFYGEGGVGKTFAGAVPLAMYLDPTFEKNWQDRFIFPGQTEKLNAFARAPESETFGKAYIFDEFGISAYSEEHAKKEVKMLVKMWELRRRKYAFRIATLTNIDLLTSAMRHQFKFIFEAKKKNVDKGYTTYEVFEVVPADAYNSYGERETRYKERHPEIPPEYLVGTKYEGKHPVIAYIDFSVVNKSLLQKMEPVLNEWKQKLEEKLTEEAYGSNKGSKDMYDQIAETILGDWSNYTIPTERGYEFNKIKIMHDFVLSSSEINKVIKLVLQKRRDSGFKK